MFLRKFVNSPFEFWMKSVKDVPFIESDSNWSGQRLSAENSVGYKEAKLSCFRAVMVAAEPLQDFLLGDGIVSHVVALQGTGAIFVFQRQTRCGCGSRTCIGIVVVKAHTPFSGTNYFAAPRYWLLLSIASRFTSKTRTGLSSADSTYAKNSTSEGIGLGWLTTKAAISG